MTNRTDPPGKTQARFAREDAVWHIDVSPFDTITEASA
jgi:hypothetical protein